MPKLKNGHEECDTCGKRYIALLAKDSCMCEVVVEHVDLLEINTAAVLKWRKRAKVAEAALAECQAKLDVAMEAAWTELGDKK